MGWIVAFILYILGIIIAAGALTGPPDVYPIPKWALALVLLFWPLVVICMILWLIKEMAWGE